jgi:hypothetical protein
MTVRPDAAKDRLPRFLFVLGILLATLLVLLVAVAPQVDNTGARPHGAARVVAVFARDATLRRTSIASAAGLAVAACVFFRPGSGSRPRSSGAPSRPTPPPVVGA